jgi:hypothetical protein
MVTDNDDDESLCDTSFNGIGFALQVEMLDEVTRAAWQEAEYLKRGTTKKSQKKRPTT